MIEGAMQARTLSGGNSIGYANAIPQPAEPTLLRALTALDELNNRLRALMSNTYEIASAVGGPYPMAGESPGKDANIPSAMARLNGGLDRAHQQCSEIDGALSAIRRALGQ